MSLLLCTLCVFLVYLDNTKILDMRQLAIYSEKRCFKLRQGYGFIHELINSKLNIESRSNTSCSFITNSEFQGRIGNQMFQVASLIGIAYKKDLIPIIHTSCALTTWFDLPNLFNQKPWNSSVFTLKKSGFYEKEIEKLDINLNWTLDGFFQSWKYFEGAENIVGRMFTFKTEIHDKISVILKAVPLQGAIKVCVHIRRGDFLTPAHTNAGFSVAPLSYIHKAMDFFRNSSSSIGFIILSDDLLWCKKHLQGNDTVFSPFTSPGLDLALFKLCDHAIVTSGSFGWWGAWITGGTTIYYSGYPQKGTKLGERINQSDYYPNNWIGMT